MIAGTAPTLDQLADELSVSAESLSRLGVEWRADSWQYPERSSTAEVVGRNRRFPDGSKRACKGGRRGLCFEPGDNYPLPSYAGATADDPILVPEGLSDTAAALDLGYDAIGRSTAHPGAAELDWLAELVKGRHVAIVAENDAGAGHHGAEATAKALADAAESVKIIYPPQSVKDLREWRTGPSGCDRAEVDAAIRAKPEYRPGQSEADRFTFYTAAEFDALDLQRDYHIPGVLAAGPVPTVLAGSFKTLKTSIGIDLLLSLATGSMFLNHYSVTKPTNVAMMSGESGGFALQSLARRILLSRGWTMAAVGERFRICPDVLNLGKPDDLAEVERFVVQHDIKVFAIDPTYLAMRGLRNDDAGSIFAMASLLEPLARLGERTGCTPIIVHHNSRGATRANPGEPAELADIAWSGFAEWAGQWLLLSRREKYDPDSDGEHLLWLTAGGRDGHSALVGVNVWEGRQDDPSGRRWQVEVEQASRTRQATADAEQGRKEQQREARKRAQLDADIDAIVKAMERTPEGETKTTIRDWSALNNSRVSQALAVMLANGRVAEVEITKPNGQTYPGFKLHPDAPGRTGTNTESSGCPGGTSPDPDDPPKGVSGAGVCAGAGPAGEQGQLLDGNLSGCGGARRATP